MKDALLFLAFFLLVLARTQHASAADCSQFPFSNWTTSWTDTYGQTRYAISAPCKVYIGVQFNVKAWVTDTTWANTKVTYPYAVQDTYSTATTHRVTHRIDPNGTGYDGSNTIYTDANRYWETVIPVTYAGTPYDHRIEFSFIDWGNGADWTAVHHISMVTMGSLSVDPYLITLAQSYAISQAQQGSTTIPATVYNPNGVPLTYRWLEGTTVLKSAAVSGTGYLGVPLELSGLPAFPAGSHTLTVEVTDGSATATATTVLTVQSSPPSSTTTVSVPVMNGWWFLLGFLGGVGVIANRRKKT